MFFLLCSSLIFAQETSENELFKKGIYHFRQENYDEALVAFSEVFRERPNMSLAAYYMGLTYKRLEDYVEAKQYLEKSLELTPKITGALIELVDLLYRLGEFDEAKKWIKIAEDEGIRPAQAKFLKGLTLQKSGEYEESIQAFNHAKDLDDRLSQTVDYQIGICYMKLKKFEEAKNIFKNVFELDPYSELADYADRYLDALDRKLESARPFHLIAKTAFEYDSNVVLSPSGSVQAVDITDQDDTRMTYDLKTDYTFKREENPLSLKVGYGLRYSKQHDFGTYDLFGNNVYGQANLSLEKLLVTFPASYNHLIVADKNYLSSFSVGNINSLMVTNSQMLQMGIIYKNDEYLRKPLVQAENRTGDEFIGSAGWFGFFAERKGFVNLRYNVVKDWTDGNNWQYLGHKIGGAVLYPVGDKLKISVNGEVLFQDFDHINTIYNIKREDQVYAGGAAMSYEIIKNVDLQVRYAYVRDKSNIAIYDYNRHVVSTGVQFKY